MWTEGGAVARSPFAIYLFVLFHSSVLTSGLCLTDCLNCFAPPPVRVFVLLSVCLRVSSYVCICLCEFSPMFSLHLLLAAARQIVLKIEISQIGQSPVVDAGGSMPGC